MDSLLDRLKAALDADEERARAACHFGEGRWSYSSDSRIDDETGQTVVNGEFYLSRSQAAHVIAHDPARTLAMVAAHRELIATYEEAYDDYKVHTLYTAIKLIAKGYGIEEDT